MVFSLKNFFTLVHATPDKSGAWRQCATIRPSFRVSSHYDDDAAAPTKETTKENERWVPINIKYIATRHLNASPLFRSFLRFSCRVPVASSCLDQRIKGGCIPHVAGAQSLPVISLPCKGPLLFSYRCYASSSPSSSPAHRFLSSYSTFPNHRQASRSTCNVNKTLLLFELYINQSIWNWMMKQDWALLRYLERVFNAESRGGHLLSCRLIRWSLKCFFSWNYFRFEYFSRKQVRDPRVSSWAPLAPHWIAPRKESLTHALEW